MEVEGITSARYSVSFIVAPLAFLTAAAAALPVSTLTPAAPIAFFVGAAAVASSALHASSITAVT